MKKFLFILISYLFISTYAFASEETLIIFDSSLSMSESISGSPKFYLAAKSAKEQLKKFSSHDKIGLRTIGLTIDESIMAFMSGPDILCRASRIVDPIKANNTDNISQSLNMLAPFGTTPLTFALKSAIENDFSNNSELKHIILITDGGESCNENPCGFIKSITTYRRDIKIDIIAIGVENQDYYQLKCITDNANGTIINAHSPSEIDEAFKQVFKYKTKINPPEVQYQKNPVPNVPVNQPVLPLIDTTKYRTIMFDVD